MEKYLHEQNNIAIILCPSGMNIPRDFAPRMDILGDHFCLVAAKGNAKRSISVNCIISVTDG